MSALRVGVLFLFLRNKSNPSEDGAKNRDQIHENSLHTEKSGKRHDFCLSLRWLLDCDKEKTFGGGTGFLLYDLRHKLRFTRRCVCFFGPFHSPWGLVRASKYKIGESDLHDC